MRCLQHCGAPGVVLLVCRFVIDSGSPSVEYTEYLSIRTPSAIYAYSCCLLFYVITCFALGKPELSMRSVRQSRLARGCLEVP